jgi:hypothetical protein
VNRWTRVWLVLIVAFLATEIPAALHGGPGPQTLSEHVWLWFSFRYGWLVLLVGMAYLTWHLVSGARRKGKSK